MFCLKGNTNLNIRKVMVFGGIKYGGEHISMTELEKCDKGHEREESYR